MVGEKEGLKEKDWWGIRRGRKCLPYIKGRIGVGSPCPTIGLCIKYRAVKNNRFYNRFFEAK
jgi:hypothetical protein